MRETIKRFLTWAIVIGGMYIALHNVAEAVELSNIKLAVSGVLMAFFAGMFVAKIN